jgi:hypothetical protein
VWHRPGLFTNAPHAAVSPRPPNPSVTMVARTEGYTYQPLKIVVLSHYQVKLELRYSLTPRACGRCPLVQGPFSVPRCQTQSSEIKQVLCLL